MTEDINIRVKMVDKRLKKMDSIKQDIIPPELYGYENYKTLVICWGSTFHIIREALNQLNRDDFALLYFKQLYPIHEKTFFYLKNAVKRIIIENNATSQFGKLLTLHTGFKMDDRILKYNGLPFCVEDIYERLKQISKTI